MKSVKGPFIFLFSAVFGAGFFLPSQPQAALTTKTEMPEFLEISRWFNAETPPSRNTLAGKVVLLDFWNYSNLRSLRRIEVLREWHSRYRLEGLVILGILTPEFEFEKEASLIPQVLKELKIEYPVALDTQFSMRRAYNPPTASAAFLIDGQGHIREVIGESMDYDHLEKTFQELLRQANPEFDLSTDEKIRVPTYEPFADFYFGYRKLAGYGHDKRLSSGNTRSFSLPLQIFPNHFYLSGTWTSKEESLEVSGTPASLRSRHPAQNIYLVAGSLAGTPVPAEVRLDGSPLDKINQGEDIVLQDGKSYLFIGRHRLYQVLRLPVKSGEHLLEIIFEEPGAEIFKMSFE